jgi:ATP-dependent helicase/nuclease subunit B
MPITRHFLGWDGPALPRAAGYLVEHHGQGGDGWDLGEVIAVVPAQRAGRRLLELLVMRAQSEGGALVPPRIVTAGGLPELLYQPDKPLAGELDAHLAWVAALRGLEPDELSDLLPMPPEPDDLSGWWATARQLRTLHDDLAGHRMRFADVPRLCAERGFDLRGTERWDVLSLIDEAYLRVLSDLGLADRNTARLAAIRQDRCALDGETRVVLIATADLNDAAAAMLRQVPDRVTALVMAPCEHQDGFDDAGIIKADYWQDRRVQLRRDQVRFVDRSGDQAGELLALIASAQRSSQAGGEDLGADQVTVGLGDERYAQPVRRALGLAGVPSRHAAGTPAPKSRPAVLLRALGRFMEQHRYDALAELLRHPDIQDHLQRADGTGADKSSGTRLAIEDWLTLLDTYATKHLQGRLTGGWLGNVKRQERLKALWDRVVALLPAHPAQRQPLPKWSEPIAQVLRLVYADTRLNEHDPDDRQLGLSLELIAGLLREQAELDDRPPVCPHVTASQAIALTLNRLADLALPDEGGEPAVELLGYLELALDDAPVLAVVGMNEGLIPSSRNADPFLPDTARLALSMHDNAHRYGRDLMLLSAIVSSRPRVGLIAAKRSDEGDPLAPSRLLLACDDDTLIERVRAFFDDTHGGARPDSTPPPPLPLESGGTNRFLIPRPLMDPKPIGELHVTAFRQYIADPYRFYLRYVLGLETLDDRAVEMDPMSFGTLAHGVLQAFGLSDDRHSTDPDRIAETLDGSLDAMVARRFGEGQRPAVRIQVEQLRQRLAVFADEQARLAQEGWRIEHVEQKLEAEVQVDGRPFTIVGKIDRIDRHDTLGYRVYDYKTGDKAEKPDGQHRAGRGDEKTWVDLQLPLYRDLCGALGITGDIGLGYINLPKTLKDIGPSYADWSEDDMRSAAQKRDEVIRALREQTFWPPGDPPSYPDGLGRVCADTAMQRQAVIDASDNGDPA